jgi:hypothetical protein
MRLLRIGYWLDESAPGWPDVRRFVDPTWDPSERERVRDHLARGFVARAYLGKSRCRLCGNEVGSLELSDGVFIWPEGLAHYVEVHDVRLPARFVEHVRCWSDEIEMADVDEEWWRMQGETVP